jgi:hypothetical protein
MVSIQVAKPKIDATMESPLRYQRTIGLGLTQMQELVLRVRDALPEPWNKKTPAEVLRLVSGGADRLHVSSTAQSAGVPG